MKYLLTSGGITNPSIRAALTGLLRKPIAEYHALCIPTAMYGHPWVGPGRLAWEFIAGRSEDGMVGLGWSSVGVLELTALPSLEEDLWLPKVRAADVLLVSGGAPAEPQLRHRRRHRHRGRRFHARGRLRRGLEADPGAGLS